MEKVLHVYGIFLGNIAIATKKLPKQLCLVEVMFHYIFGLKNSTTTYICVGVVVFFTAFSCKTQCAIATKKDTKNTSQKIKILIDILKKAFNPAYVELELVPFHFWVFKKNPLFKKTQV